MSGQTAKESKTIDNEKNRLAKQHEIEVIRIDCDYDKIESRFKFIPLKRTLVTLVVR